MSRRTLALLLAAVAFSFSEADIYMHVPRGSNDRNCGRSNNENRQNGNRLFDSQNNDKGGYSCPRAFPFPCYKYTGQDLIDCNQQNVPGDKTMVDRWGNVLIKRNPFKNCIPNNPTPPPTLAPTSNPTTQSPTSEPTINSSTRLLQGQPCEVTQNERMKYYSGSVLTIEWTNQHGSGRNNELHSDIVIQYALEQDMEDNCGIIDEDDLESMPWGKFPGLPNAPTCHLRDGYPVNNMNTQNEDRLNGQATETIIFNTGDEQLTLDAQDDYRYGRHETLNYYKECRYRRRNRGLYIADQNVNNNIGATATRQNPGGTRYGYECPEESEYYPYWHWTPWRDVAVIVSQQEYQERCEFYRTESQNVKPKNRCTGCPRCRERNEQPNNVFDCEAEQGTWVEDPAWNIPPPDCFLGKFNRQNHLGNAEGAGSANQYNWTLPQVSAPTLAVLRIRYNISTGDFDDVSLKGDARNSGGASKIADDTNNEVKSYKSFLDGDENIEAGEGVLKRQLSFAINSDQHGRTFQDRSYVFEIHPRGNECPGGKIHNLNVRGKRGNIVDNYPAVEYDFAPQVLVTNVGDCVHYQWDGSDYNVNRGGNNGDGGPYDAEKRENGNSRADRTNLVQMALAKHEMPMFYVTNHTMFSIPPEKVIELAFLHQRIDDPTVCRTIVDMIAEGPNQIPDRNDREYSHQNCGKLGGHPIPYYNAGLLRVGLPGTYYYMSTRNNNFSNRGQKGVLIVEEDALLAIYAMVGVTASLLLVGLSFLLYRKKKRDGLKILPTITKADFLALRTTSNRMSAVSSNPKYKVKAIHNHVAQEQGELSFKKGDTVTVLKKDPSGWWEGECNGSTGVFPSNYVEDTIL